MDNSNKNVTLLRKKEKEMEPPLIVKLCGSCSDQPQEVKSMHSSSVVLHGCLTSY